MMTLEACFYIMSSGQTSLKEATTLESNLTELNFAIPDYRPVAVTPEGRNPYLSDILQYSQHYISVPVLRWIIA